MRLTQGTAVARSPSSVWTVTLPDDAAATPSAADAKVERTVDLLYQSTRDPARLTQALQALRHLLDATRVAYVLPVARVCVHADESEPDISAFGKAASDAWCTPDHALDAGGTGIRLCPGIDSSPAPGTTLPPAIRRLSVKLHDGEPGAVFLFLERTESAAPFGSNETALLRRLLPDLARVSRLHGDMAPSLPAIAATMTVEALRIAHCVVDEDLVVVQANAPMQTLLDGRSPIGRKGALLRMHAARDEVLLHQAVANATAATPRSTHFLTTLAADGRRLSVTAVPMHARHQSPTPHADGDADADARSNPAQGRLVLLIVGNASPSEVTPDTLHSLYDMSPAEAKAALQVLLGGSGGDMARRLGVSLSTFKTQLQAAYAKTGTRRKTELMRLMLAPGLRAN